MRVAECELAAVASCAPQKFSPDPQPSLPRMPDGSFFIDRNGVMFHYVLEYLRALAHQEPLQPGKTGLGRHNDTLFSSLCMLCSKIHTVNLSVDSRVKYIDNG